MVERDNEHIMVGTAVVRNTLWGRMVHGAAALAIWLAVAFSLGWYYTITYYGRTGIPIPTPESCAALILYYFSVINAATEIQAVHWMLAFPVAATLWALALVVTARRFGFAGVSGWRTISLFAVCSLPLALPGPWLMIVAGTTDSGFSAERMLAVALRRGNISPWAGLSALYVGLGVVTLTLQALAYRRVFPMRGLRAWRHAALAAVTLVASAAAIGAIASIPLRTLLE